LSEDEPTGPGGPEPRSTGAPGGPDADVSAAPLDPAADLSGEYLRRARLAEDRLAEVLSAYRQVRAENEGFRDRITRNLERRFDQRRERLLLKFIDILDNLDRALEAAEQSYAGNPLIEGLILVRTQLLQTLQEEGLERIPVLGMPYDPNFSEAVATEPVEDPDHHHVVVKELLRGYRLNGRVARASRVVVGEFGTTTAAGRAAEAMIGADEVPPVPRELEPEEVDHERSLEDIIAHAERSEPTPAAPHDPVALDDPLHEIVEEPAPGKPRK